MTPPEPLPTETDRLRARVAELEAENARLIAAWPRNGQRCVAQDIRGAWLVRGINDRDFPTRDDAVRHAAGLDKGADA